MTMSIQDFTDTVDKLVLKKTSPSYKPLKDAWLPFFGLKYSNTDFKKLDKSGNIASRFSQVRTNLTNADKSSPTCLFLFYYGKDPLDLENVKKRLFSEAKINAQDIDVLILFDEHIAPYWLISSQLGRSKAEEIAKFLAFPKNDIEAWPINGTTTVSQPTLSFQATESFDDVFVSEADMTTYLGIASLKKNVIFEGAPGVGKSFIATRIAERIAGSRSRVLRMQFHQSIGYEDFVQGWRPIDSGKLEVSDGIFLQLCRLAHADPNNSYVLLIDEINRGNVSRIMGEMLTLIEADKREERFAMRLTYQSDAADLNTFFVPPNVHIVATMNVADRSLALVDFALRRRFAFLRVEPAFGSRTFLRHLLRRGVDKETIRRIVRNITSINSEIAADRGLGPGYVIGHSYFCPVKDGEYGADWYENIAMSELEPLMREYWFDDTAQCENKIATLFR